MTSDAAPRTLVRHSLTTTGGRYLLVYGELRGEPYRDADGTAADEADLHQRYDRLTDTWISVSPARNVRPHSSLDRRCPLCPGGAELPFSYEAAVFENRFPSFRATPPPVPDDRRLARSVGRCEVVLYTERHEGSLATLTPDELANVVAVWRDRSDDLWADPAHRFVMMFENRGEGVGATLSHPHGQIYAFDRLPPLIAGRLEATVAHRTATGACLGCLVVAEDAASERVVLANASFVVAVPFAAHWPFEVHVRARRHGVRRVGDLDPSERRDLAAALREVVRRYDALFGFELPYMMVLLEAPASGSEGEAESGWHFAVEFYPPHRGERLTKVRASVETAAGLFINDTLPEASAARLAAIRPAAPVEEAAPVDVVRAPARGAT